MLKLIHSIPFIQEYQREIDDHRYTYQDIKRLGSEITRDPKTADSARVSDTMSNLTKNWEHVEMVLSKR